MEYRKCECGCMVTTAQRFCTKCSRPIETSAPNKMYTLIRSIPALAEFSDPVSLGCQNQRETFRTKCGGTDFLLCVADCGDRPDLFHSGVNLLHKLSPMGFAPPVRHHLHTGEEGTLGILILEDKPLPTLQDQLRKGELTLDDALRACTILCRILENEGQTNLPLNITPDSLCFSSWGGFSVSPNIVILSPKELENFRSCAYADPNYRFTGMYQPGCAVWSVAMVLHSLVSGLDTQSGGLKIPIPYQAPELAPAPLGRCLYQALQMRQVPTVSELAAALVDVRSLLTPQQLRIVLSSGSAAYGAAVTPAPSPRNFRPEPPPFSRSCAPAASRSCAPAPAPAQTAGKKGGLLSKLFGRKEEPSKPAPAPAPIPRTEVNFSPPPAPVTPPPKPRTVVLSAPASDLITENLLVEPDAPWEAEISGSPTFPEVQPGFCPPASMMPPCAAPAPQEPFCPPPCAAPAPAMEPPAPRSWAPPPRVDRVQFSAVAPKETAAGDYAIFQLFMYEQRFRQVVEEALAMADTPAQEKRSGFHNVRENTRVKVVLTCPDLEILDNVNEQTWCGDYLQFDFAICVPEDFRKRQLMLNASVYFDDIPATRLMLIVKATCTPDASIQVSRQDIFTAFVSYASQDRARVAGLIQGMRKARPDMDIFFDVTTLRSGEDWEKTLFQEIRRRDVLFLCWSQNARNSPWVEQEWHYALEHKGIGCIEPIPLEPPDLCPPPVELSKKHFNDSLLYISR